MVTRAGGSIRNCVLLWRAAGTAKPPPSSFQAKSLEEDEDVARLDGIDDRGLPVDERRRRGAACRTASELDQATPRSSAGRGIARLARLAVLSDRDLHVRGSRPRRPCSATGLEQPCSVDRLAEAPVLAQRTVISSPRAIARGRAWQSLLARTPEGLLADDRDESTSKSVPPPGGPRFEKACAMPAARAHHRRSSLEEEPRCSMSQMLAPRDVVLLHRRDMRLVVHRRREDIPRRAHRRKAAARRAPASPDASSAGGTKEKAVPR